MMHGYVGISEHHLEYCTICETCCEGGGGGSAERKGGYS